MTILELIEQYRTEEYRFFKFNDANGKGIEKNFLFKTHSDYLNQYLGFYRGLNNLTEVIVYAANGIFKITDQGFDYFIKHPHQEVFKDRNGNLRGISVELTEIVRHNLFKKINDIESAKEFDEILAIVADCKVHGFGELAIYDTSMRISSFLNLEPEKVYLHAGARKGLEILEKKGYIDTGSSEKKYIDVTDLPLPMQALKPSENEHMLCAMKDKMENLNQVILA